MQITKNTVVSFEYTLTNPQRELLDTSEGGQPLSYLHGSGGIIPGLEQAMEGHSPGDAFQIVIPPEQAYGVKDLSLIQPVPRKAFGGVADIHPGMQFQGNTPAGSRIVTVTAVDGDTVTIDANHELAGVTLHFDVKVVEVRAATSEEVAHGHVHGAEGHH